VSGQLHTRYPLDRRMGGPQSRSGRGGEKKNSHQCPCQEMNPVRPTLSLVSVLNEIFVWMCNVVLHIKGRTQIKGV
jgi:hypothetical protein